MRGYDQWKTASPYDDDEPAQTINEKLCDGTILIGYGKPGHGMNGKDADLDRHGQCLVKELRTVDPVGADTMRVDIHLHLYADVCEPYIEWTGDIPENVAEGMSEEAMDIATEIVCDCWEYEGEWTGSDYWCFWTDVVLSVRLEVEEYEEIEAGYEPTLQAIAQRIANAIYEGNEETKKFEKTMASLNDAINELGHKYQEIIDGYNQRKPEASN